MVFLTIDCIISSLVLGLIVYCFLLCVDYYITLFSNTYKQSYIINECKEPTKEESDELQKQYIYKRLDGYSFQDILTYIKDKMQTTKSEYEQSEKLLSKMLVETTENFQE